ncbi:Ankyrin repeat and KH domain-containing protein mask [Diplonema papillatum]|nr:Ankyrin repeat and KH domain-containing protein mask [Diplonema papillatum]
MRPSTAMKAPRLENGCSPLLAACTAGCLDAAQLLIEGGACVETAAGAGRETPLMRASAGGQVGVVRLLLRKGARPDGRDKHGCTALYHAAVRGHLPVVNALRENSPSAPHSCIRTTLRLRTSPLNGME